MRSEIVSAIRKLAEKYLLSVRDVDASILDVKCCDERLARVYIATYEDGVISITVVYEPRAHYKDMLEAIRAVTKKHKT